MHDLEHEPAHGQQLDSNSGFWDSVPDSRLDRWRAARSPRHTEAQRDAVARGTGGRHHHDDDPASASIDTTASIPVVTAASERLRQATEHVDPLMRRAGAVAIVIAALVPVALSLRSAHPSASALAPSAASAAPVSARPPATTSAFAPTSALAPTPAAAPRVRAVHAAVTPTVAVHASIARAATKPAVTSVARTHRSVTAAAGTTAPTRVAVAGRTAIVIPRPIARVCAGSYRVVFGDAWIVIASKTHVSLSKLLAANHATASTPIYPGRTLCLPTGAWLSRPVSASHAISHTVTVVVRKPTTTHPTYVPARSYTRAEVIQIIRDVWPDALEVHAIFIATRESNLVPTARNSCCQGLFQIYYAVHAHWLAQIGITSADQLLDPRTNARAAYAMYQRSGGFGPWGG
jgi:LysM repeat protein